jgi:4-amino-4-deoxy-L-arabinose transferase-like glycosyltransferase
MKPQRAVVHSLLAHRWLLLILGLAAVLRLGWPGLTEFKADEARLLALALDMAELKSFPLRGLGSSVGVPNFPVSVWLFALPLFVSKHPYAATLFVAVLNTAAVYLCYRLTRRYWGEPAALTAALLFAASPWAVIYSRKIWAQDLLPLFVLGYVGSALAAFVDGRRGFLALHIVLLAVVIQIHFSALAFLPLTLLLLVFFWRRARDGWKEIALGAGAALLTGVPFAIWMLGRSGAGGLSLIADVLSRPASVTADSLRFTWMVLTGADIHALAGPGAFRAYLDSIPNIDGVRWLWGLLVLGGLALALYRRRPAGLILAAWLIVPVVFFVRHSTPVFPHYFIIVLPAGYMLAGVMVQSLVEISARRGLNETAAGFAMAGLVTVTALAQAAVWMALLFFVGANDTRGGFGTPLETLLNAAQSAKQAMAARPAPEILVVGEGDDPAIHEFPAVMDVLLRDTSHRFVDGNAAVLLPGGGAVVLMAPGDLRARAWYAGCATAGACRPVSAGDSAPRGPGAPEIAIVELPAAVEVEIATPFPEPRLLANGVELLGWEARPVWTVIWRVGYLPPAADYHFFNHALGAQTDGVGYPSRYWRDGDRVISFFDLDSAGGPVRVGMYEYPSITNVPVMDALGNPYSDAVTAQP